MSNRGDTCETVGDKNRKYMESLCDILWMWITPLDRTRSLVYNRAKMTISLTILQDIIDYKINHLSEGF